MKEKEINVVNFQCPHCSSSIAMGINKYQLKKGAIVVKRCKNGGYWFGRVKSIEWANDPQDMFFCKCKTIVKDRQLSKAEYNYIQKTYFGEDIQ